MSSSLPNSPNTAASTPAVTPALTPALSPQSGMLRSGSSPSLMSIDDEHISVLDLFESISAPPLRRLNSRVRQKSTEIRQMAIRQRDRVLKSRERDIERLKSQVNRRLEKIDQVFSRESVISTTEKYTFAFNVLNLLYLGALIAHRPQYVHLVYTAQLAVLFPIRVYQFNRKEYQYYLADLCYFVNLMCLMYIWVFPGSERLYVACYALCFGTVSWAVVTWRNSLVLHSVEKTTSSYIHIVPPAVLHVITHRLDPAYKAVRFPGSVKTNNWDFVQAMAMASVWYIIWQALYYYFITVKRSEKIKAGRVTSFEFLRKAYRNKPIGKMVNSLPEPYPVFAFMFIQFGYQLGTMILCPLWYYSELLSTLFLTFILFTASYNGACYYIDIFGKRFKKELEKLQAEVERFEFHEFQDAKSSVDEIEATTPASLLKKDSSSSSSSISSPPTPPTPLPVPLPS